MPEGVPGVVVVDASGVEVGGISVGRDKPGLVGGRVDVMKTDLVGAGVSSETLMHEPRLRLRRMSKIRIFCMGGFYFGKSTKCRTICLTSDLNFNPPIHVKIYLFMRRAVKETSRRFLRKTLLSPSVTS